MSTMTSAQYLAFCRAELQRSKRWRASKTTGYDDEWRRYINLYRGKHYDSMNGEDQLTVNMIFATKNVMAPAVAINNPRFTVNARKPENVDQAIITEEVLNYLWRTNKYQADFRLAVDDWIIIGHGWLKATYKFVKTPVEKEADVAGIGPEDEGAEYGIDDREDIEGNTESEMIVKDDRPIVERISPFDMFVDPDARHPKEMRWIAQRTWRPIADISVDSRYSATQRKRVGGSAWSRWSSDDADARESGEKPDKGALTYGEVIEFYDIKRNKLSTFAASGPEGSGGDDGFLIKPKPMPYEIGHPFVMLRNYEVPDHFYPMGDVCQIESLQLELNETRNQMLNYRKKFRRGWVYSKDLFDREGIDALESDMDNVAIPVLGDGDPSSAIAQLPAGITPPEFFDQSALITNDLDRVSGVSDYQRGAQTAIRRTATEASMIQDAANARAQDRLAKVEGILSEVAERIIGLMQQYLTGEHMARIVTMPIRGWLRYDADRIAGKFDFEVQGGSTEPQNETFRRQSALQLVDVSVPFMQQGVVKADMLYQELLRRGFGIKDAERFINKPEVPQPQGAQPPEGPMPGGGGPPPGPPPPTELTPELIAQMRAGGMGGPPSGGPPPEMMQQGPPQDEIPPELLQMILSGQGMPGPLPEQMGA